MACNICGSPQHEATTGGCPKQGMGVIEYERFIFPPTPIGWACPVCHKGNTPDAKTCGHCAKREPQIVMNAYNAPLTGGDMTSTWRPSLHFPTSRRDERKAGD